MKRTYMNCSSSTVHPMLFANSKTSRLSHETGYGSNLWPAPTPLIVSNLKELNRGENTSHFTQDTSLSLPEIFERQNVQTRGGVRLMYVKPGKLQAEVDLVFLLRTDTDGQ